MRIAINGRLLIKDKLEGIGYFTRQVVREIIRIYPQHDYLILFDRPPAREFIWPGVEYKVVRPAARHPLLYRLWFEVLAPWHLRSWDAEIFVSFDGFTSPHLSIPVVTAIHDLAYLHYPDAMKSRELGFYRKFQPLFAEASSAVLTVSEFSKQDLCRSFGLPAQNVHVVYNGSRFEKNPPPVRKEVLNRFELRPQRYFVYTGSLHPRKNIVRLIKAFDRFSEEGPADFKLVLVGRKAWKTDEIYRVAEDSPVADRIIFTGYLPDEGLWSVLSLANAMCYVSLFEGFGVPVLDAFHAGVPVIASTSSSIPEVAGDAAVMVDAQNIPSIAAAMISLASDSEKRTTLIREGEIQKLRFSWALTARQVYEVISAEYEKHYELR